MKYIVNDLTEPFILSWDIVTKEGRHLVFGYNFMDAPQESVDLMHGKYENYTDSTNGYIKITEDANNNITAEELCDMANLDVWHYAFVVDLDTDEVLVGDKSLDVMDDGTTDNYRLWQVKQVRKKLSEGDDSLQK